MRQTTLYIITLFITFYISPSVQGQCDPSSDQVKSQRLANYIMDLSLDHENKTATGSQIINWTNNSPDTVNELRFYMYLNAFKNNKTSYLRNSGMNVMGQNLNGRTADTWGWCDVTSIKVHGNNILSKTKYIQPDDGNEVDETVLQVNLDRPVLPGETITIETTFESRLPKTIARSGWSRNNFFLFVHWYPKLGVFEQKKDGSWGWNCHQFLPRMEFYGEFGTYDVTLRVAEDLVIGASGCEVQNKKENGQTVYRYIANDVIDFAWVAYPDFIKHKDSWNGVDITILSPPHHKAIVPRIRKALKGALDYLDEHVGPYPYSTITVMDPPAHATRSGFMEYPTFITGGSFYGFPTGHRGLESLIIHEFTHQYFMGVVASNEKEEAWLDEGFVTFYEDEVMESIYGKEASLYDFLGYKVSNSELTRNEYTSLSNKRAHSISEVSYKIQSSYKGIIYAKTATVLRTIRQSIGANDFDYLIQTYFDNFKFKHPRKADFLNTVVNVCNEIGCPEAIGDFQRFFDQVIDGTAICDFAVTSINSRLDMTAQGWSDTDSDKKYSNANAKETYTSTARVERLHDLIIPIDVEFEFSDGSKKTEIWDATNQYIDFTFTGSSQLKSVHIDPNHNVLLDIDYNNNSMTMSPNKYGITKYAARAAFWVQNILSTVSFLM